MLNERFIDAALLELGDVLLVRSSAKGSAIIAQTTAGRFSHAALYAGSYKLFEALPDGLGFSPMKIVKAENEPHRMYRLLCSMSEYQDFSVYRCPREFQSNPDENLYSRIDRYSELLAKFHGLEYPQLERLADASPALSRAQWLKKAILRIAGNFAYDDSNKAIPGLFCSELVVTILTSFGFSVLKIPLDACEIAPSDLADPNISNLVEVPEVIGCENAAVPNDSELLEHARGTASIFPNLHDAQSILKSSAAMKELVREQAKLLKREAVALRKTKKKG